VAINPDSRAHLYSTFDISERYTIDTRLLPTTNILN